MRTLHLHIISPESEIFAGEVEKVSLPGVKAPFTVFPRHAPIISTLTRGEVVYVAADGTRHSQKIGGGFVEVKNDTVTICIE